MEKTKQKECVGIDVSKKTLDAHLHLGKSHSRFTNDLAGITELLSWISERTGSYSICFEHCGVYAITLSSALAEQGVEFYVVSGLAVKRSMGIKRGKTDKLDAKALARYAYLHQQELKPYELSEEAVSSLKALLAHREHLVKQCTAEKIRKGELVPHLPEDIQTMCKEQIEAIILLLTEQVKSIDKEIRQLIKQNQQLNDTYNHLTSIKGVGPVLAASMIVLTNNFRNFDCWRKFASYAGVAPFDYSSGTSIKGRTKISHLANKRIKATLSQAAASAMVHNTEMRLYFNRKLMEGKPKMLILNNIKNKLIARMFAVAKRKTPYVDVTKFAA